jgi:hypothetical protein
VVYVPPDPPKFIRDGMSIEDLEGARPKFKRVLKTRESNRISDIEGASPKVRRNRELFAGYHSMNYDDVTKFRKPLSRVVNPLAPEYFVADTMSGDFTRAKYGSVN